jgi:hypothetical protein
MGQCTGSIPARAHTKVVNKKRVCRMRLKTMVPFTRVPSFDTYVVAHKYPTRVGCQEWLQWKQHVLISSLIPGQTRSSCDSLWQHRFLQGLWFPPTLHRASNVQIDALVLIQYLKTAQLESWIFIGQIIVMWPAGLITLVGCLEFFDKIFSGKFSYQNCAQPKRVNTINITLMISY